MGPLCWLSLKVNESRKGGINLTMLCELMWQLCTHNLTELLHSFQKGSSGLHVVHVCPTETQTETDMKRTQVRFSQFINERNISTACIRSVVCSSHSYLTNVSKNGKITHSPAKKNKNMTLVKWHTDSCGFSRITCRICSLDTQLGLCLTVTWNCCESRLWQQITDVQTISYVYLGHGWR